MTIQSSYPIELSGIDIATIINLYRVLHGGDYFNTYQAELAVGAAVAALYAHSKRASFDNFIENLAKLNVSVTLRRELRDRLHKGQPSGYSICQDWQGIGPICFGPGTTIIDAPQQLQGTGPGSHGSEPSRTNHSQI
jgi:hypothetical protein